MAKQVTKYSGRWLVTMRLENGNTATETVFATNKSDAEYRAAMKLENAGHLTERTVAARPYPSA